MERNDSPLPLLSIVIASRNRALYAISAINSILKISDPRLQLVVQDNSDSRELESYVREHITDNRLRYRYTPPPLSPMDNFNSAVELATGEYMCLIGDDDGVNPEIMQAVSWAKANDLDAVRPNLAASYFWPDMEAHAGLQKHAGKLFILKFSGNISLPVADTEARKCIHNAGLNYLDTNLPKIYHGIIRRKCLDEVRSLTGNFFKGLSPDIFGALAVSNFVNRMCAIDYPLTISGTSIASTAGDSAAGKHNGALENAPHLRERGDYQWDKLIPRFYSVQTIWAESAVVALRETRRNDLLGEFNLPLLHAQCVISHPAFTQAIVSNMYRAFTAMNKGHVIGTVEFLYNLVAIFMRRAVNSLVYRVRSVLLERTHEINGLGNIEIATSSLKTFLADNNYTFDDIVGSRNI